MKFSLHYLFSLLLIIPMSLIIGCSVNSENNSSDTVQNKVSQNDSEGAKEQKKVIVFFGNSLTAGYGLESSESYPSLIQKKLDSLGFHYEVINAGVSGETSATGSNRVGWVIDQQHVDIFVLELGANDGLRGLPVVETYKNLEKIISVVRNKYPKVKIILAGMMIPPSMGHKYTNEFQNIFPELAVSKEVELIPFLLKDVAGIDSLNLDDGIHPNATGQKIVAENVWMVLKEQI